MGMPSQERDSQKSDNVDYCIEMLKAQQDRQQKYAPIDAKRSRPHKKMNGI